MNFFYKYFAEGWSAPERYNIYDTLSYFLLALLVVYFSYKHIFHRIKITYKTACRIVPLITLGAMIRVMADTPLLPRCFFTVTPGIWLIFFAVISLFLLFDRKGTLTFALPIPFIAVPFFLLPVKHASALLYFGFFYLVSAAPFLALGKRFALLRDRFNLACVLAHMFDATSSFVNVQFFNYIEIHVVGGFLTTLFGTPLVMYGLKLAVLPVLFYLDKEKDRRYANFLKLVIFALGFGPGIRNLITVLFGV